MKTKSTNRVLVFLGLKASEIGGFFKGLFSIDLRKQTLIVLGVILFFVGSILSLTWMGSSIFIVSFIGYCFAHAFVYCYIAVLLMMAFFAGCFLWMGTVCTCSWLRDNWIEAGRLVDERIAKNFKE